MSSSSTTTIITAAKEWDLMNRTLEEKYWSITGSTAIEGDIKLKVNGTFSNVYHWTRLNFSCGVSGTFIIQEIPNPIMHITSSMPIALVTQRKERDAKIRKTNEACIKSGQPDAVLPLCQDVWINCIVYGPKYTHHK